MIGASFENGASGFRPYNLSANVTQIVVSDGTAYSGSSFLRAITTETAGSVAKDFAYDPNIYPESYPQTGSVGVIAWVRSAPGQGSFSGALAIWQLDKNISSATRFSVGNQWTLLTNLLETVETPLTIRVEFYMNSVNEFLDIDSVMIS